MEKITNIEIKNFKSIRHQKIDGCKRINVFIGYPNVGKSNILEALGGFAYGYPTNTNINFKNLCRYEKSGEIFFNGDFLNFNGDFSNEGAFVTINENLVLRYSLISNEVLSLLCKLFKNKESQNFQFIDNDFSKEQSFSYFIDKGVPQLQFLSKNNFPVIKKYDFDKSKTNNLISRNSELNIPFGDNLSDVLQIDLNLRKEVANLLKPYNLKLLLDRGGEAVRVAKSIDEETIFSIPLSQIADTLQRLIFYKATIKSNKKSVLLFEEPEAHMFPPYIKELTSDIIFDKNDNQYFIATHSPFVLNELIEEAQDELSVYVVDYDKGETIIKRLTDEEVTEISQYGIDLFFNLESYLEKNGQPHSA